jgi:hypothetical protein
MTFSDELPKKDEQIDSFVDKLENLILAKSRHYEERKQLETEFLESRRKSKESQDQVNCQQSVSVSDNKVSPSPSEEHLNGKNQVAPQVMDNLEMTEDAKECKIEHLESEPLVSTNAFQEMDILEVNQKGDLESELLVSTNAPQVMDILEMTEDVDECKIEHLESELLVSTNAPQVMHILEMTEDAKEYKIEATESEPLVSTNAPQVMDILEMTEDAKEYKIEATESEHFPSTDAPQEMQCLEMTEDAKECKKEATESEPFPSTNTPQEILCLEMTEDVKEYKIEHLESELLVSTQDDVRIQDTPSPSPQNQNNHDHDNMTEDNPLENHSSLSPLLQDTYKHDSKFNQKEETTLITLDKNGDDHDKTDK